MDVSEHPEVADQLALEGEDRRAVPPDMTPRRWNAEQLAAMVAMEAQLAEDPVPFLCQRQDIGRVAVQRSRDELDITDELVVSDERRTQRATKGEPWMKQLRDQSRVRVVP